MGCYHPLQGWRGKRADPVTGKAQVVFNRSKGYADMPVTVPCGQCIGCRIDRSKEWAVRCYHEASLHENNCFITLTYSDAFLPIDLSCDYSVFQLFMKRLRKKYKAGIRFFHCGEYGDDNGRPHYHALLFNHDFSDRTLWSENNGKPCYRSAELEELWPYGFSTVQDVNFAAAAYCARYIMKKVNGHAAKDHYVWTDPVTGEVHERKPEYCQMSLKPGLGLTWYKAYRDDLWPDDFCVIEGKKYKIPKYYLLQLEKDEKCEHQRIKDERQRGLRKHSANNTKERLAVREKCETAKFKLYERPT